MPGPRFIHPSWNVSEDVHQLSFGARLLFIGMIVSADDEGRGKGSVLSLLLRIFPGGLPPGHLGHLDGQVSQDGIQVSSEVSKWRAEIAQRGMAVFYTWNGENLYQLLNWQKYQKPKHFRPSEYPGPESDGCQVDDLGPGPGLNPTEEVGFKQGPWIGSGFGLGLESENKGAKTPVQSAQRTAARFEEFWKAYPSRNGKKRYKAKALTAWKDRRLDAIADEVLAGLRKDIRHREEEAKVGGFSPAFPDCFRYLRDRGWEIEDADEGGKTARVVPTREQLIEQARREGDTELLKALEAD